MDRSNLLSAGAEQLVLNNELQASGMAARLVTQSRSAESRPALRGEKRPDRLESAAGKVFVESASKISLDEEIPIACLQ